MSIDTWIAEFYPVSAVEAAKGNDMELTEHALRKWTGLTKENLDRHGINTPKSGDITEMVGVNDITKTFSVAGSNCAMCIKHSTHGYESMIKCAQCPIVKATGVKCTDGHTEQRWATVGVELPPRYSRHPPGAFLRMSPWSWFFNTGNPMPMIQLLEITKAKLSEE